MFITIAFLFQAVTTQPAEPAQLTAPEQEQTSAAAEQPQRKRVCRTSLDTRTGMIPKQRKVCRFVDGVETANAGRS